MEWLLLALAFLVFATLALYRGYRRAKQLHELGRRGRPLHGAVTARRKFNTKAGTRRIIYYEYNADGQVRKGRSHVGAEDFERFAVGEPIAVRYLPDNPAVVAPEFVVMQAVHAAQRTQHAVKR